MITMHIPQLMLAGFNHANNTTPLERIGHFFHDRLLFAQIWSWIGSHVHGFVEWLKQPHILALVMAFWITFTVVMTLFMTAGFGPIGIGAGTLAAAFQSWAYGGFTPAGGVFATLTSMGMLGILMPPLALLAAGIAGFVSVIVWACGAGR